MLPVGNDDPRAGDADADLEALALVRRACGRGEDGERRRGGEDDGDRQPHTEPPEPEHRHPAADEQEQRGAAGEHVRDLAVLPTCGRAASPSRW